MEGGLKRLELEMSVPSSDLLGVSGLSMDWSPPPPPNIMLGREAGVLHRGPSDFRAPWARGRSGSGIYPTLCGQLTFLLGLAFSLSPASPDSARRLSVWLP
jgi:hypothetical protein